MPTQNDANTLHRETDRLIAEREHQEQEQARRDTSAERARAAAAARSRRDATFAAVQENTSRIENHEEELVWCRAVLRNWNERHRELLNISAAEISAFMLLLASPLGVVTIDLLVLSYAGREVAKGAIELFKGSVAAAWIVPAAVIAFTFAYIVVELAIGASRDNTRLSREQRRRAAQLAILLWLALPTFIAIISLANSGVFSTDAARTIGRGTITVAIVRAAGFAMFALAAHGFILFFGPAIIDAIGYAVFKVRQMRVRRRIRDLERGTRVARSRVESGVRDYHRSVTSDADGRSASTGPFSTTTTRVVNETFGQEVIEPPPRRHRQQHERSRPGGNSPAGDGWGTGQEDDDEGTPTPRPQPAPRAARTGTDFTADHDGGDPEWPGTIYDMSDEDEVR
jgi:hypothetical protein